MTSGSTDLTSCSRCINVKAKSARDCTSLWKNKSGRLFSAFALRQPAAAIAISLWNFGSLASGPLSSTSNDFQLWKRFCYSVSSHRVCNGADLDLLFELPPMTG